MLAMRKRGYRQTCRAVAGNLSGSAECHAAMPDDDALTTATRDDLISALAHRLLFDRSGKAHRKPPS